MTAFVDPDVCIGCTLCASTCPAVFSMRGVQAQAISGEIPAEDAAGAAEAAQGCPVGAIRLQG